ncbi:tetratricopeptide repeat protein [Buchnera aphidicola (Neophyllaphis podocarpi)]|uniref:YfgM family protein n=1 Tax=Buchnera aphidicola TaxID=9 RepID=UPI0031B80481
MKNKKYIIITIIVILIIAFISFEKIQKINENKKLKEENIEIKNQKDKKEKKLLEYMLKSKNSDISILIVDKIPKYISTNDIKTAEDLLIHASEITTDENLKNIINFRLAKIQIEEKKTDKALMSLEKIKSLEWIGIKENLKGDIFKLRNENDKSIESFKKVIQSNAEIKLKEIAKIKINEI